MSVLESSGSVTPLYLFRYRSPGTGVEVRDGFPSDAEAVATIASRAFFHAHAAMLHPVDLVGVATRFDEAEIRAEMASKRSRWLVAEWAGHRVGCAQLRERPNPEPRAGERPAEVVGVYAAPDWSGYGVGSALIEASARLARRLGYDGLWVRSFAANRHASDFLARAGFSVVARESVAVGHADAALLTLVLPLRA